MKNVFTYVPNKRKNHDALLIMLCITLVGIIFLSAVVIYTYMYTGISRIDTDANFEETLFEDAIEVSAIGGTDIGNTTMTSIEFGIVPELDAECFSINLTDGWETFYFEENPDLYGHNLPEEEIDSVTQFAEFSLKQKRLIESARNIVIEYIRDSNVLEDKEYLIEGIQNVPFKLYTSSTCPDLNDGADAVHFGHSIYCDKNAEQYFSESMFVHELVHHLRFLTLGKNHENHRYFATMFDEAMTDLITNSTRPCIQMNVYSGYIDYHPPMYEYLNIFGEEALEAYFYGYSDFFDEHGGTAFQTEHDAFAVVLESYTMDINAIVSTGAILASWNSRFA